MPRYFLRTRNREQRREAAAVLNFGVGAMAPEQGRSDPTILLADLSEQQARQARESGIDVYEDVQFAHMGPRDPFEWRTDAALYWQRGAAAPVAQAVVGLPDVLDQIGAPRAWQRSRGAGVTVVVVDTGICPTLPEIPLAKRAAENLPTEFSGFHWQDAVGHGSMCATIAGATRAAGGRFDGVAPDCTILSARTRFGSTDLYRIYDELITLKRSGAIQGPIVVSNSYGFYSCSPVVALPEDHPYLSIVTAAIEAGITVVYAAGNNHWDVLCNNDPAADSPNTIWAVNSIDAVLSVGTVDRNESNRDPATPHPNSSRGPGQWARELPKPDCVAPTYGTVTWGCEPRWMDWWGTSGACPQVAGLAALLLSIDPKLSPHAVGEIIRGTSRDLGAPQTCVGRGMIDCWAAVTSI